MTTTISKLALATAFALGFTTAAMAGKGAVANAPAIPPGIQEAVFDATGASITDITFDPIAGTYTIVTETGQTFTFSSLTVAAFMRAY